MGLWRHHKGAPGFWKQEGHGQEPSDAGLAHSVEVGGTEEPQKNPGGSGGGWVLLLLLGRQQLLAMGRPLLVDSHPMPWLGPHCSHLRDGWTCEGK